MGIQYQSSCTAQLRGKQLLEMPSTRQNARPLPMENNSSAWGYIVFVLMQRRLKRDRDRSFGLCPHFRVASDFKCIQIQTLASTAGHPCQPCTSREVCYQSLGREENSLYPQNSLLVNFTNP